MTTSDSASADPTPVDLVARLRAAGCVFAEEEAALLLAAASGASLEELVGRRVAGEPLELVLGWAELDGVRVNVAPGVFVPRQRSVLLVRAAAEALLDETGGTLPAGPPADGRTPPLSPRSGPAVLVDLGCGTGALGLAVSRRVPGVEVYAADVDPAAAACARTNLPPERVFEGDLFEPLPTALRGGVAVIVANGPYVPTDEIALMPPEARDHEHRVALDGGADGLDVQRRVVAEAPGWLRPGGVLLVECGAHQAATSAAAMRAAGLDPEILHDEDLGGTAVRGTLTSGPPTPHPVGGPL